MVRVIERMIKKRNEKNQDLKISRKVEIKNAKL